MDQITEQVDAKMQDAANILIHLPWTFQAHRGKKKTFLYSVTMKFMRNSLACSCSEWFNNRL